MKSARGARLLALACALWACALWACAAEAGEAPGVARVLLSVEEAPRVEAPGPLKAGGVVRLRAVDPGWLEVRVGQRVLAACHLGWGEGGQLLVLKVEPSGEDEEPPALPRVVSREHGREEVEVALPEEVEEGEEWLEVRYAWEWRHQGRPALERRWRRLESEAQARWRAQAQAFEEEFPLPGPADEWTAEETQASEDEDEPPLPLDVEPEAQQPLTAEQRRKGLMLLEGSAPDEMLAEESLALLVRVVEGTPEEDFPALEEALTRPEVLKRLLRLEDSQQVQLGQSFTRKALAAAPLPLEDFEALPGFHLGREGEVRHLLNVPLEEGREGETLLRFGPVRLRYEARYFATPEEEVPGPALRARDWVRVEWHGQQPQTRLMTALELALSASAAQEGLVLEAVGRIGEAQLLQGGLGGLARAPLGAVAQGSAEALALRAAVRGLAGRVALVGAMAAVDTHREELSRTPEGRAFLAVHDVALLALAARDVSRLATSGLWREWVRRAGMALPQVGPKATAGLRESLEAAQVLAAAVRKVLAEGRLVATGEGLTFRTPEGARALRHAWFSVRAEMAAQRLVEGLRQGEALTLQVERTLEALKQLSEQGEEWARAWSAVTRRAATLSAPQARAYLEAVEKLRAGARPEARAAVAQLLHGSGSSRIKDATLFLQEAEWLVSRPGLEQEALTVLTRKAAENNLSLRWLGTTALTAEDLNFLGRDVKTPWVLFRRAAEAPDDLRCQLQARRLLRGIAGEMVFWLSARRLAPRYRLTGRQVPMADGHILDFELVATDGVLAHALEVKGWTADTWRRALNAHQLLEAGTPLDARQLQLVQQLERLVEQLKDAARAPRGRPFLVHTDKLSQSTREGLINFLQEQAVELDIVMIGEAQMLELTRRLRAAFGLPEVLSSQKAGATP